MDAIEALDTVARLARELGDDSIAADADALRVRTREGRYFVACVGQFKRGKSTLINALLNSSLLPVGTLPVTAIPTIVRFGPTVAARVRHVDGEWRDVVPDALTQYVAEEGNPGNARRVAAVEVTSPAALLANGMCLVDTPGLGSVFPSSSAATRDFLPHVDAAIVVLGSDPPITGDELDLIGDIAGRVPDLAFVLGKADRVTASEREAARAFARQRIAERLRRDPGTIWILSAADALAGRPSADWDAFLGAVRRLAATDGQRLAREAAERGVTRVARRLLAAVDERLAALTEPEERVRLRLTALDRLVAEADRAEADLAPLLAADARQLADASARRAVAFLDGARPMAVRELDASMRQTAAGGLRLRSQLTAAAGQIARRIVEAWLPGEQQWAENAYRGITGRFAELTQALMARLIASEPMLAGTADVALMDDGFTERSRFYFHDQQTLAAPASPFRLVADAVRGWFGSRRAIERDAMAYLTSLLEVNAARVESDVRDRVAESRRHFETQVASQLRQLARSARRASDEAARVRAAGQSATSAAIKRLRALRAAAERLVTPPA